MKKLIILLFFITSAVMGQDSIPKKEYGRTILSINPENLVFNRNFSIAYEGIGKHGYIGFRIPIVLPTDQMVRGYYMTGLQIKVYPTAQGVIRGYAGTSFLGRYDKSKNVYAIIGVSGGISYTPTKHLNFQVGGTIGKGTTYQWYKDYYYNASRTLNRKTFYQIDFTIGIRI